MKFIVKHTFLFYLISFTWGFIASFIGLLIMIPFLVTGKVKVYNKRLYGVFPKCFGTGWGFEMGCFFFTSYDCANSKSLILHELGHGVQNLVFGPLQLPVITIPSIIRFWYLQLKYYRHGKNPLLKYDDIWFEELATNWGNKYYDGKEIPTKYSCLVINRKMEEVRRVLISYKKKYVKKEVVYYGGTKIIDVCDYFKNPESSHKYVFTDKDYYVESVAEGHEYTEDELKRLINVKRKYHYFPYSALMLRPYEFSTASREEALAKFSKYKK